MVNELCGICGATWDNRTQSHKRGLDCIDKIGANVQRLLVDLESFKTRLEAVDGRVAAIAEVAKSHVGQIEDLIIQLNKLEKRLLELKSNASPKN